MSTRPLLPLLVFLTLWIDRARGDIAAPREEPQEVQLDTETIRLVGFAVTAVLGLKAVVIAYIHLDAPRRGMSRFGWIVGALVSALVTIIVYLLVRRPEQARTDPPAEG